MNIILAITFGFFLTSELLASVAACQFALSFKFSRSSNLLFLFLLYSPLHGEQSDHLLDRFQDLARAGLHGPPSEVVDVHP